MKKTRRFLTLAAIIIALSLCLGLSASASAVVEPWDRLYVSDYAGILSPETEDHIVDSTLRLKELCGGEIAVVTIDFLNELDSEQYAYELFNKWGVGDAERNNGLVFLIVAAEDKWWIAQGAGLEDVISSGDLNSILSNYFEYDYLNGNVDSAVVKTFDALISRYESYYGISVNSAGQYYPPTAQGNKQEQYYEQPRSGGGFSSIFTLLFVIVVFIIIISALGSGRRRRYGADYVHYPRRSFFFFGPMFGPRYPRRPPPPPSGRRPSGGSSSFRSGGSFGGGRSGGSGFGGGGRSGGGSFGGGGSRGGGAGRK